ncbi:hypothetical protein [Microbacterium sp. Kw_RZR3]|jgi:hypothetical protein|uniref:hypothetical protein n=1 Tax=unclassified Microbacterium TaxID=2609290 RepID=UPI0023D9B291|nr:hypothetical protein [Microbacterium sp. Kw_RZR3]MDF2045175.1 hypothetical protein [Microbacterium sp. Kw_RZR3]
MTWQIFVAFAVPVLGLLGSLLTSNRDPGEYRRLKHAAEALSAVPAESAAFDALDKLVAVQAEGLRGRETVRLARNLNVFNLVFAIILGAVGALTAFWLWNWSASVWGTPASWLVAPACVLLALVVALIVGAGFSTIFKPPAPKKPRTSPS